MSRGLLCLLVGCHGGSLGVVTGKLVFSSPDQPTKLTQTDAGVVQIAFGQVAVGATKSLALDFASVGGTVTIGALAAIQPDAEFSLPFATGTVVQSTPSQITVSFTPGAGGIKSGQYKLIDYSPGMDTVLFELSGEGLANGINVAPNPLAFGEVEINQSQSLPLTVTNDSQSGENLVLSAPQGQNPGAFTVGAPSSAALAPGDSATLNVTFIPRNEGAAGASFTVSGGPGVSPVTVDLGGVGLASWIQVASPLSFGFVQLGGAVQKSVVVTNLSKSTTLHLVAPAPSVTQPGAAAFMLGGAVVLPSPIPPGQSVEIPVVFTPLSLDEFSGTLSLTTDDPLGQHPIARLDGYGGGPHISCLPQLNFGPVPPGYSVSQDTICTNDGIAIPTHPELALQIAQKDLASDSSEFVPTLLLPDGGPAGSRDSVSLFPGQEAKIQVAFLAPDAGLYQGRLAVPSNDIDDSDAGTLLAAQGVAPGPCTLSLTPGELGFGEVPPGSIGILPFEVSNTGQNFCVVSGVALDPASDPAFSVSAQGSVPRVLSFPGNADNPAGLPTSLALAAQFAPTTAEVAATGTVEITSPNTVSPVQSIALTGISQSACLSIQPTDVDFGRAAFSSTNRQICVPASASLVLMNGCTVPVTVTEIALISGPGGMPQFALQDTQQLPLVLAPTDQASLQVGFVPTSVGAKLADIGIASSEFPGDPFLVTLQGDAELPGLQTDTFKVPALAKKLDLLWILDEDDDYAEVQGVVGVLPQLLATLNANQIDYQIAVTSTDTCDGGMSDQGAFEPCDHCISNTSANATYVTSSTSDPVTVLADLFNQFDLPPQRGFCEGFNGDEHFFDAIADAFSPALLSGHNAGFIRAGAYLAIVIVNGDAEDDANGGGRIKGPYLTSLADVLALVQGLKPDPSMVSVSYINSDAGTLDVGQRIGQLVQDTGGIEIDTTVGAAVWQASLLDLFAFTEGVGAFRLMGTPAASSEFQVEVDGVPASAWTYDPYANEILFNPGQLPAQGSTVTVTYTLACP